MKFLNIKAAIFENAIKDPALISKIKDGKILDIKKTIASMCKGRPIIIPEKPKEEFEEETCPVDDHYKDAEGGKWF